MKLKTIKSLQNMQGKNNNQVKLKKNRLKGEIKNKSKTYKKTNDINYK